MLLGSACGGGSEGTKTVTAEGAVPSSSESTATSQAPTTTAKKPAVTAEALQGVLLSVENLPAGYALSSPDEDDGDDSGDEYGDDLDPTRTVPTDVEAEVSFQKGPFGPFLRGRPEVDGHRVEDVLRHGRRRHPGHEIHHRGLLPGLRRHRRRPGGRLVIAVGNMALGSADTTETEKVVERAHAKIAPLV